MLSPYTLLVLVLCVRPHDAGSMPFSARRTAAAAGLGKTMANLFLAKEKSIPAAKHSMDIFQKVTQQHVLQNGAGIKAQQAQQLAQYSQDQIVTPTKQYLQETIAQHLQGLTPNISAIADAMKPDVAYFTDPNQNFIQDFFGALTQQGTSLGAVQGPDFILSAPCLISTAAQGVGIVASAINIVPQLFAVTPTAVGIFPQGINIQPAIVYISPYGVNISPIGVLIQPMLISVTPILDSVSPDGVSVAPTLITVGSAASAEATAAASGRKLLGAKQSPGKEQSYGDVFLQSYEKWMQQAADMVIRREATPQDAHSFLSDVFTQTGQHLDSFGSLMTLAEGIASGQGAFNLTQDWEELAQEFSMLYPVETLQTVFNGSLNDPNFDVSSLLPSGVSFQDPMFFDDQAVNVSSTLQGVLVASSFINYAPCLVANAPLGVGIAPSAINIQPDGVIITPEGVNVQPQGINIQPMLIYVAPVGESVTPTGVAIGPTLISIVPTFHMTGSAAVSIGDTLVQVDTSGKVVIAGGSGSGGGGSGSGGSSDATAAASG